MNLKGKTILPLISRFEFINDLVDASQIDRNNNILLNSIVTFFIFSLNIYYLNSFEMKKKLKR